jgi:putative salt-induced outer membrane protein
MRKYVLLFCLFSGLNVSASVATEDVIETLGGAKLLGSIVSFGQENIVLQTSYAGEITIIRNQVKAFSTKESVFVRLQDGTTMAGNVTYKADGNLLITAQDISLETNIDEVVESWLLEQKDPEILRVEKEQIAIQRSWSYKAAADIAGKSGNSDELGTDVSLLAELFGVNDSLKIYSSIERAENNGNKTSEEIIFGTEYTSYFNEPWGWFVRAEVERDEFENLDIRSTLGLGISYHAINKPHHDLKLRLGVGYRSERFSDNTKEDLPTLDFGLDHKWQFASWGQLTNLVMFTPAITKFSDYLLIQDSGMDIPLGFSKRWIMRFGFRNEFKSEPAQGRKKLDSSYYSRIQLNWD